MKYKNSHHFGNSYQNYNKILFLFSIILILLSTIITARVLTVDEGHRGMVQLSNNYQIFPEDRIENAVYFNKKFLFSIKEVSILKVKEIFDGYIYLGKKEEDSFFLGYHSDHNFDFKQVADNYWQLTTKEYYTKIFRVNSSQEIEDILPLSKTGKGLVQNQQGTVAFYHIYSGKPLTTEEGANIYQYFFRIHILSQEDEERVTIKKDIFDTRPKLELTWISPTELSYQLSNGEKYVIDLELENP